MNDTTKILVVDDAELERLQILVLLTNKYKESNLFSSSTIQGAWDILNNNLIDIVLLDMYLPGKNGADLITDMLNNDQLKNIPIIVVTGTNKDSLVKVSYEKYVSAYLHKPVERNELFDSIKKCLNNHKQDN